MFWLRPENGSRGCFGAAPTPSRATDSDRRHGAGLYRLIAILVVSACGVDGAAPTIPPTLPPPSTIVVTTTTMPRPAPLPVCEPPGYVPTVLPAGVGDPPEGVEVPADLYTSIEGTSTSVWVDESGAVRLVLIRGSLPPREWAGRTVRLDVAGVPGALGTMPDGAWAVAWAESAARCDQYSLVVYPPTTRDEVEVVAAGLQP